MVYTTVETILTVRNGVDTFYPKARHGLGVEFSKILKSLSCYLSKFLANRIAHICGINQNLGLSIFGNSDPAFKFCDGSAVSALFNDNNPKKTTGPGTSDLS